MSEIFALKHVQKNYSSFSLNGIDISCQEGTIMGLIGPNGAGKTTIINLLAGTKRADGGSVEIFGKKITDMTDEDRANIGVIYDSNCLPETLRPAEIEKVFKGVYKKKWNKEIYYSYVDKMGIPKDKMVKEMSRGNQIKLNVAAALAHSPNLLILDEITGALDPIARDEMMRIFLKFIEDEHKSIFFSSHITTDLEKIADYITFINEGEIVFSKEKDSLLYNYFIFRCKASEFPKMNKKGIVAFRENGGSVDVIWDKEKGDLDGYQKDLVIEKPSIEEIMLIITKGGKES